MQWKRDSRVESKRDGKDQACNITVAEENDRGDESELDPLCHQLTRWQLDRS